MQVLRNQLATIYEAFSQRLTLSLPEPRIQAADYAIWERGQLEDHGFDQQLDYWRKQLAPPMRKLSLAKSRQRMKGLLLQTKRIAFDLDESSLEAMKAAARQENVTPFVIVLSVLISLSTIGLARLTSVSGCFWRIAASLRIKMLWGILLTRLSYVTSLTAK